MSRSEWTKVDFQQFINEFGNEIIIHNAPTILYSKRDKEHEAYSSLIAFFFLTGGLFIYIALSYFLAALFFNLTLFIITLALAIITDAILIIIYIKSNVYIRPLESWVEIYAWNYEFFCLIYYPVFSGKCFPNKAKNVIFKLFQEGVLNSKIDITQIEIYLKLIDRNRKDFENLGYFFQYGKGRPFNDEQIHRNCWKFFPYKRTENDNFLAIANWDHQYEWRDDLEFDFDKLHEYAPWVIQRWNEINLKPLTEEYKEKIYWNLRYIESKPKLKPWEGNLENQAYKNPNAYKDIDTVNNAIIKIIGDDKHIKKIKDIRKDLSIFKSYFRDLTF